MKKLIKKIYTEDTDYKIKTKESKTKNQRKSYRAQNQTFVFVKKPRKKKKNFK